MQNIPEDVMQSADTAWMELASLNEGTTPLREAETAVIARAILAERERCAKVDYKFRLTPMTAEEQAYLDSFPEDIASAAQQAAWLQLLNRGIGVAWVELARAILAERERCALVAEESRARSLNEIGSKLLDHRFAASKAGEIATSIRNPMGYLNQIEA